MIKWLWEVLDEMESSQRVLFLKFVSGRSRLPVNAVDLGQRFQIMKVDKVSTNVCDRRIIIYLGCKFITDSPDLFLPAAFASVRVKRNTQGTTFIRYSSLQSHRHGQLYA